MSENITVSLTDQTIPLGAPQPEIPASAPEGTPIPKEPSPLERFHPSLDPEKFQLDFDEKTGRVKVIPKMIEEPAEEEAPIEELAAEPEVPPAPPTAPEATGELQQLRAELAQSNQLMTAMAQAMMTGRPLNEVLGLQPAQPAQPAEPDYSQVDMYDPAQAAQLVRDVVRAEIQASMREHQPILQGARQQQEFNTVYTKHGKDPDFERKAAVALELTKGNPNVSFEATFDLINKISQSLAPQQAQPTTATQQQASANKAQRTTLTPEQQQQKAEQAKKLPSQGSGVRGAGLPNLPKHIKGLGNIRAWVAQQAQLGNL